MKREDKVISLELAKDIDVEHKRLKIRVESEWWWIITPVTEWHIAHEQGLGTIESMKGVVMVPAYDTAELVRMVGSQHLVIQKALWYKNKQIEIKHIDNDIDKPLDYLDAFARMYLWLLKEGYIKGGSDDTDKKD